MLLDSRAKVVVVQHQTTCHPAPRKKGLRYESLWGMGGKLWLTFLFLASSARRLLRTLRTLQVSTLQRSNLGLGMCFCILPFLGGCVSLYLLRRFFCKFGAFRSTYIIRGGVVKIHQKLGTESP